MGALQPEEFFGAFTIQELCGVRDCDERAVAVLPLVNDDLAGEPHWYCHQHADDLQQELPKRFADQYGARSQLQEITRTCLIEVNAQPCGAHATHIAVLGVLFNRQPWIATSSVCDRHAKQRGEPNEKEK